MPVHPPLPLVSEPFAHHHRIRIRPLGPRCSPITQHTPGIGKDLRKEEIRGVVPVSNRCLMQLRTERSLSRLSRLVRQTRRIPGILQLVNKRAAVPWFESS